MRRFRWFNRLYARLAGYFWMPCPVCGKYFGGHEASETVLLPTGPGTARLVCWRHDAGPGSAKPQNHADHPPAGDQA